MVYTPILDRWMRRWFWRGRDNIDVLEQDHPIIIGSHHQKTFTIDGRIGYCGGMNLKENDWDATAHQAFEPRRSPYRSGYERRLAVAQRREVPEFPPRHDLTVRLEGPAVGDLVRNFAERWRQSIEARRRSLAARVIDLLRQAMGTTPYPELPEPPSEPRPGAGGGTPAGSHWVQIVRTTPGGEEGILGAYRRAIANARRYVYIENQYFRSPLIGEALREALAANSALRLAVVVRPVNDGRQSLIDPSAYWTAHTLDLIREVRPGFQLTQLLVWGRDARQSLRWLPVDVHAKVMVVDDVWLTVGSANINDRGFKTEAEINAVVLDEQLARDLRVRLMAEHLEISEDDPRLTDLDEAFDLWEQHADDNPHRRARGDEPLSRVHHFVQKGLARPPFGVGSGVF
jgi:phosphatidylserine/phosphatidylglycerophosphate/cardiolipin synthase-like enzyme